jgi:hypothetical protein
MKRSIRAPFQTPVNIRVVRRQISLPIASSRDCKHLPRMTPGFGAGLVIPDLWRQESVRALQQGKDVVLQAPTGSCKTYIFELYLSAASLLRLRQ